MLQTDSSLTFQYHDELNPLIWEQGVLKPEIKEKLLQTAEAFLETVEIPVDVEDITLTGSLANYNYTNYSDFDLHIITDCREYNINKDILKDYFKAKKTVWNSSHEIKIKGYDVEVYIQDILEPHHSSGVYSIKNNEWLVKPVKAEHVDKKAILKKVEAMKQMIDHALSDDCDLECAEMVKSKLLKMRQAGLEKDGEFSAENLAFKELRRSKDLERLILGVIAKKDKELSLNQESTFKNYFSMPGIQKSGKGSRGPRHQGVTAGLSKLAKANTKSVNVVAKVHSGMETPFHEIENLKKKPQGKTYITPQLAHTITGHYNMNIDKVSNGEPRGLSTSGIKIGYDPVVKKYYLIKNKK